MKKEIRNLLMVMVIAVLAAVGVTGWFVLHYGPSGSYRVPNVLLEPETLSELNFNDVNPKTGQMDRYVFDKIVYIYWNPEKRDWITQEVDVPHYAKLYQMIKGDQSLLEPSDEIRNLFIHSHPARLAIRVRTESEALWQKNAKDFLQIEFAEESDYYGIELHQEMLKKVKKQEPWIFFYHPKISSEAKRLFLP